MTVVASHLMKKIHFMKIEIGLNYFFFFKKKRIFCMQIKNQH